MQVLTQNEIEELSKIPNVSIYSEGLMSDIYRERLASQQFSEDDPNMKKILTRFNGLTSESYDKIGTRFRKQLEGFAFDFIKIPAGTKFYKGTKYFYDCIDTTQAVIWCAGKKLGAEYALMFGGGLMVYRLKEDVDLLIMTVPNLYNMWRLGLSKESIRILKYLYAPGMNVIDRVNDILHKKKRSNPNRIITLYPTTSGVPPGRKPYKNLIRYFWNKPEYKIHEDLIQYGIKGTYTPFNVSPFYSTAHDEQVAISPLLLELDRDDPLYWKNWGLELPPFDKFMLNESSTINRNMRVLKYYFDTGPTNIQSFDGLRVITYNVHGFISNNAKNSKEWVLEQTTEWIKASNATVTVLQEVPHWALGHLESKFPNMKYCLNGMPLMTELSSQLYLVVLSKNYVDWRVIEIEMDDKYRYVMLGNVDNIKIACVHYPIGSPLFDRFGVILEPGNFDKLYEENSKMRIRYTDMLLAEKPNIIVGDCNFQPGDPEFKYLEKAGYITDSIEPTNVHSVKVDYIFHDSSIGSVETHVVKYNESDHRPVVGDIFLSARGKGSSHIKGGDPNQIIDIQQVYPSQIIDIRERGPVKNKDGIVLIGGLIYIVIMLLVIIIMYFATLVVGPKTISRLI